MAVIVQKSTTNTVVVPRPTIAQIQTQQSQLSVAATSAPALNVGTPGLRGLQGPGDNETFDVNLAQLYTIAKA